MMVLLVFILTAIIAFIVTIFIEEGPEVINQFKAYRAEVAPYKKSKTMPKLPKGYYWRIRTVHQFYNSDKILEVSIYGKKNNYSKVSVEQVLSDESKAPEVLAELIDSVYTSFKETTFVDDSLENALNYYKGNKPKALGRKQDKLW